MFWKRFSILPSDGDDEGVVQNMNKTHIKETIKKLQHNISSFRQTGAQTTKMHFHIQWLSFLFSMSPCFDQFRVKMKNFVNVTDYKAN